ncbi:MAG: HAD-IC family P-type ATPase [Bacilli bacterium]|nr:HAD-IC family P-type ATPase [Bacilli bacterium]
MHNNKIERYNPLLDVGLTSEQVLSRFQDNLINYDTTIPTKSIKQIVASNIFTLFNFINIILGVFVVLVGSYKNLLFLGVIFCNVVIGTIQEIRSKKMIDKLSVISSMKSRVLRDGVIESIDINNIVLDDIIIFELGNQVVVDSYILDGSVEVNESFITGEADSIVKKKGDLLLSGSFIVAGKCKAKVEHIGNDNYTSMISSEAKYVKKVNSEIMNSLNKIIRFVSYIIFPLGLLLFLQQLSIDGNNIQNAVISTVAACVGMIPEGLVLLTSTVLAVSVIRLSKYNVLVQELFCIETLSRVDVLCLDKTGTLTEGKLELVDVIPYNNDYNIDDILSSLATSFEVKNPTLEAIFNKYHKKTDYKVKNIINFSSDKKYSAIEFEHYGTFIMGAPEFVLDKIPNDLKKIIEQYSCCYRTILLAHSKTLEIKGCEAIAVILIKDKVRPNAKKTLDYFKNQGVQIKIISGDNPLTVSSVASDCGFSSQKYIDARTLLTDNELKKAILAYDIFGRVTPVQKKKIILFLKEMGHTVAMTGDGVNDCLALREADCSIALSTGSEATRNVSQLVLLDSDFGSMPHVVLEGRRTINNIERSATLFLVKTIYSILLAFIFIFINRPYPFMPIQLTLTSVVTIGIPSFILALEPNKERIRGHFFFNVIGRAIPTALTIILNIIIIMIVSELFKFSFEESSTLCVILTGFTGFTLLYRLCKPFNLIRFILFISMLSLFVFQIIGFRNLYSLTSLTLNMILVMSILMVITYFITKVLNDVVKKLIDKKLGEDNREKNNNC